MTRRRWIYRNGEAIEVGLDYAPEPVGPLVIGDLPSYRSPVTGLWVDGRVQRREDLKRSGSRPYEGREQELKEAARQTRYAEERQDRAIERTAREVFHQLPPQKRRILEGR
jgi:hypothetical protein